MASMTAGAIRSFVRTHLDVDADELPNELLDTFMRDGVIRIISYFDESPIWLQVDYGFATVVGQQSYDLDSTAGLISPKPLQAIDDVRGPLYSLSPRPHRQIRSEYRTDAPTGTPQNYSIWGRSLYLWPKPAKAEVYQILGVRQPNWDWLTSPTQVPDLPEEFHPLIAQWALARSYAQQDDPEMANFYRGEFSTELKNIAQRWRSNLTAQPLVLNGGSGHEAYRTERTLGPLVYEWE
jgi:hypothetical protein